MARPPLPTSLPILVAVIAAALALVTGAANASELPAPRQIERLTQQFLSRQPPVPNRFGGADEAVGEGSLLPGSRVVALYGAPQLSQTVLGMRTPRAAARKLAAQSAPFESMGERPVVGELDLVSVFATAGAGPDGLFRSRQSDDVIELYLEQARAAGARLMLDIQPGRSSFAAELAQLNEWIAEPDVDIGLDPEWNVGRRGIPGRTRGRVTPREVNAVIRSLAATVKADGLPPKLLVVHQFRRRMVRSPTKINPRPGVQPVLNFDGIGPPRAKAAGYAALSSLTLFNGFSLFYQRDTPLMTPAAVLSLQPLPDFLLYQ